MVAVTLRSLPGIALAEMTTVSPSCSSTCGWSLKAMRVSAESGSPWLPVERMRISSGRYSSISVSLIIAPSGTLR